MAIIVDNFSGTPQEGKGLTVELDYAGRTDGQPVYVGYAPPSQGTPAGKAEPVWKIMKLLYSGSDVIERLWADGDTKYDNIWNARATLPYS